MSYSKQTWDTNSYVNPTRMNHIEDGIKDISDDVEDLKDDSGWQNLTTSYTAKYRKKGSIVEIMVRIADEGDIPPRTVVNVGTLPTGFRPSIEIVTTGNTGSQGEGLAYMYIKTNGVVQIVNSTTSIQRYLFSNVTFIV